MQGKTAVIGAGNWGTALAALAAESSERVFIYALEDEVVKSINESNENTLYMKGIKLPENIGSKHFSEIANIDCDHIIWTVPTQFSGRVAKQYASAFSGKSILIATKGIEIDTGDLVVHILEREFDGKFSVLSGPSFAKEVAGRMPTAVSIAAADEEEAKWWQNLLSNNYFRCYYCDDIIGVEVGGAIKNVMAIATGISDGLGFGHNARAGLITRGLTEMARLGIALGGKAETFMGLSGMGDLVLTCTGDLSRNRQAGLKIASGMTLAEVTASTNNVAEGVYTTKAAYLLAKRLGVDTPIINEVYEILYNNKKPLDSVKDLMSRRLTSERI
ncbi:NAD(P)H-dependent glycerol-3-phosphate dehydrogenase [Seleniivibrio woodruffii]|uniref:NAD(P)H-dependent glycerol-3-phosphate dehydrogenase n=1 Tax=Seleniivibrio woodruffii TaxID=1078050 RepID=UPI0039E64F2D